MEELGTEFARNGVHAISLAGRYWSYGCFCRFTMAGGGAVTGVIPGFMMMKAGATAGLVIWLSPLTCQRGRRQSLLSDAAVALPGGVGTLEELTEVITLKQLVSSTSPLSL
ncbi:MAG: LOG family protein [Bacteroidales bacterium]